MNTDTQTQNAGGNDVVARIINVLVTEVLLKVEGRINDQLVSLSNRLTALECAQDELRAAALPQAIGNHTDCLGLMQDKLDEIDSRLEDVEYKVREQANQRVIP